MVETARRELAGLHTQLQDAQAQLAEAQRQLAAMRAEMAKLDQQVKADRATIEARLSDVTRLSEQIRALTALRDQLERQAQEAAQRAGDEARRRGTAEASAGEEAQRREAAERVAAEQTRLAESARAQVALLGRQLEELRNQLARIASALDAAETSGRDKDAQISALGTRLNAALAARVEELQRYRSDFFGRLREVLGDRTDVRIVGDRFVFQSEVLFPPASAELRRRRPAAAQGDRPGAAGYRQAHPAGCELAAAGRWPCRPHADPQPHASPRTGSFRPPAPSRSAQLLMAEGLPSRPGGRHRLRRQPAARSGGPRREAFARNRRIELRLTDR